MRTAILELKGSCKHVHQSFTIVIQHHIHKSMSLIASHPQLLLKYQPYIDHLWFRTQFSHGL